MALHPEAFDPIVILVGIAIAVVVFYYLIRWIRHTLGHLGLSSGEIAVILWATLVGALINIPLVPFGEGYVGVNMGGAVVPVVLSIYLIRRKGLPINEVLVGILIVTIAAYAVTRYEPGVGVIAEFPWWLVPPFAAFLVAAFAYWHERPHSAALAYVSGTIGTLMGADILRLPEIFAGPAPTEPVILSLGGAGVFDMVFLTGILAVTMEAGLLARTREDIVTQSQHDPIQAEYQQWVERKEKESQQMREKYEQQHRARRGDDRTHAKRQVERQSRPSRPATARATSQQEAPAEHGASARTQSRYQPRSGTYRSRYRSRGAFQSRYRGQRTRGTTSQKAEERRARSTQATARQTQEAKDEQARGKKERKKGEREPREGPRPPPRQPRPASGTKRIPASHRARGLYK